jgi:hypothetical protein
MSYRNPVKLTNPRNREHAKDLIDGAPDGWIVVVRGENRRDAQNRLFWEVMGDLSKAQPEGRRWTPETWRDAILHYTGHAIRFEIGLDGSGAFPVGFRSSQLGVSQMSLCLEAAFAYGSRHGVVFTIDRRRAAELFGLAA